MLAVRVDGPESPAAAPADTPQAVINGNRNAHGIARLVLATALALVTVGCDTTRGTAMDAARLSQFALNYTAAWCSQNAASVAAFFAEDGSLMINDAPPAVGRKAITEAAQGFMTTFPDLVIAMDGISVNGKHAIYRWTLTGRNTGPGGTGSAVSISGYEEWTFDGSGLVAASLGHFDAAEYQRQLKAGASGT